MGEYKGQFIIYDERNGETVDVLDNIDIDECSISEEGIEQLEEFVSVSIEKYEEYEYGL